MPLQKEMNYSYWELKQYFNPFDLIVVGAGIVGLNAAIAFRKKNKKARILVLERGILPNGASTKNAGFACFGSLSELSDDLANMDENTVWETVKMRWDGLALLRNRLGDKNIGFEANGGFELFDNLRAFEETREKSAELNKKIRKNLGLANCYSEVKKKRFGFKGVSGVWLNQYEGQIDTARMMESLASLAQSLGILTLNNIEVNAVNDLKTSVEIHSSAGIFKAGKVIIATNGFAGQLLKLKDVKPARAQVLITRPIPRLRIKGTFHYQQGYYYFRNVDGRLLFGGGRNLDITGETTTENALNQKIQNHLDTLLRTMILPHTQFEVEHRWTGIMGVGSEKKPIIRAVSPNVVAAVRMGGMGIAIGSLVGERAANLC